ncbi:MAG: TetR family transcriptional regulator [Leifsonia xyli]|nr:MAG: TetR family transcriptional regulator [Leifsonia xyli]
MSEAYARKKQPELVRRMLMDAAARIAASEGLSAITIDRVAKAASVTKGGLFYHFPSKQALIDGIVAEVLARMDKAVDVRLAADPDPKGRFTRAYVETLFDNLEHQSESPWATLSGAVLTDFSVRRTWFAWLSRRVSRDAADDDAQHGVVRLAADGACYAAVFGFDQAAGVSQIDLRDRLVAMTRRA